MPSPPRRSIQRCALLLATAARSSARWKAVATAFETRCAPHARVLNQYRQRQRPQGNGPGRGRISRVTRFWESVRALSPPGALPSRPAGHLLRWERFACHIPCPPTRLRARAMYSGGLSVCPTRAAAQSRCCCCCCCCSVPAVRAVHGAARGAGRPRATLTCFARTRARCPAGGRGRAACCTCSA